GASSDCTRCPRRRARSSDSRGPPISILHGNSEPECRSLAEGALHPDAAPVHLDELLGDAETQAGAPVFPADRGVDLPELREDVVQLIFGDANAGVAHAVDEVVAALLGRDLDPSLFRELDRVAGEVHEALRNSLAVAVRDGKIVRRGDHEIEPLLAPE